MLRKLFHVLALTTVLAAIPTLAFAGGAGPEDCCCPLCCPGH